MQRNRAPITIGTVGSYVLPKDRVNPRLIELCLNIGVSTEMLSFHFDLLPMPPNQAVCRSVDPAITKMLAKRLRYSLRSRIRKETTVSGHRESF